MSKEEAAKKQLPKFPLWNCEFVDQEIQKGELTVGDKFELTCSGKESELDPPLKVVFSEEADKYKLVVLDAKAESSFSKKLLVTSYKPGSHSLSFEIQDKSGKKVQVVDFPLKVKSVIEQGKQPKEFGPYGPIEIGFGWIFWSIIAAIFLTVFGLIFFSIRGYLLRKEQIANLSTYKTSLSPFNQFNKEIRILQKKHIDYKNPDQVKERVGAIKKLFDLYLIRRFTVPALDWSSKKILNKIKKDKPSFFKRKGAKLSLAIFEFKKAQADYQSLNADSFDILIDVLRERINEFEKDLNQKRLR